MTGAELTGAELRGIREAAGVSQTQLVARLGMSQTMLSRIEQGAREVEPETARRIRALLIEMSAERHRAAKTAGRA